MQLSGMQQISRPAHSLSVRQRVLVNMCRQALVQLLCCCRHMPNCIAASHLIAVQSWNDLKQGPIDPFAIAEPEIDSISERLRQSLLTDIPALGKAAEYFFQVGLKMSCGQHPQSHP